MILIGFLHRRHQEAKAEALAASQKWWPDEWHLTLVLSGAECQPGHATLKVGPSNTWMWRWRCFSGFKILRGRDFSLLFIMVLERGMTSYLLLLWLFLILVDSGGKKVVHQICTHWHSQISSITCGWYFDICYSKSTSGKGPLN